MTNMLSTTQTRYVVLSVPHAVYLSKRLASLLNHAGALAAIKVQNIVAFHFGLCDVDVKCHIVILV